MLNYLEHCLRPDLSYAVHQCARFSENPKTEHGKAIKWIGRYLKSTKNKGIHSKIKKEGLIVYVDADFAGNWDKNISHIDRDTARSRYGYVITYLGVPVSWDSKLQDVIALSSTESEYIGLSASLLKAIHLIHLIKELESKNITTTSNANTTI